MVYLKERCALRMRPVKIRNQSPQMKTKELYCMHQSYRAEHLCKQSKIQPIPFLGPHFESDTELCYQPFTVTQLLDIHCGRKPIPYKEISIVFAGTRVRRRRERACLATQAAPPGSEPGASARQQRDACTPTANLTAALGSARTSHCRLASINNITLTLIKKTKPLKVTFVTVCY